nr:ATP synthase F0 subunit 8 [Athripsodes cinereus]
MPQMMPLNWLFLFILFTMTFTMFLTMTYYYFYPSFSLMTPFMTNKSFKNNFNWKW